MLLRLYVWASLLADPGPGTSGGGTIPNPPPQTPPGLDKIAGQWVAWFKWGAGLAGMLGLIACGIMMMIGRRNRSHLAGEGAAGLVWVLAGLSVVGLASSMVAAMMGG
jgi:hypothetical protein